MTLATLTVTSTPTYVSGVSGVPFNFATALLDPSGHTLDQLLEVQETLMDVGVDGRRWRRVHKQFREFRMSTVADSSSYGNLIQTQRSYLLSIGNIGDLTVSLAGTSYSWKKVKILECNPSLRKGILVGDGATAGSAAVLFAEWQLVLSSQPGNL